MNTQKGYVASETTPVTVNETEWIKNNSQSNNTRNVYKHKTTNGKIRTNYKHNNGRKNTLYGFNKNKAYVDPALAELMKINKNTIKELIDNFKDKFKNNPEIEPIIEEMEREVQPLLNSDTPTEAEIRDAEQRIKKIIHRETVIKPQISQITVPAGMVLSALGNTFIGMIKILSSSTTIGLALLANGGTRKKRRTCHQRR
jgi:hypothetical protein